MTTEKSEPEWKKYRPDEAFLDLREKYRPKTFAEVIGNKRQKLYLISSIRSGILPKAIIFHGPKGVGKTSLAYLTCWGVNCEHFENDVCGKCGNCQVSLKYYPDGGYHVSVYDCGNLDPCTLDDIIRHRTSFLAANKINRHITFFDELGRLTEKRQQFKFLRKLETSHDLFIFCLIDLSCLEEAFTDRATVLKITPPSMEEIIPWLESICKAEGIIIGEKEALNHLAEDAQLLPRACLGRLQLFRGLGEPITTALVKEFGQNKSSLKSTTPGYTVLKDP